MKINIEYTEEKETLQKFGNKLFTKEQVKEIRSE